MNKKNLISLLLVGFMVGCGSEKVSSKTSSSHASSLAGNSSSATSSSSSHKITSSSSSSSKVLSEISTDSYTPSFDDNLNSKYSVEYFLERVRYFVDNIDKVHSATYSKRGYVRPQSVDSVGVNEYSEENYTYYNGPLVIGQNKYRKVEGIVNETIVENSGYDYVSQGYSKDDYFIYLEKLPKGVTGRVSYSDVSKNDRYNNLYTLYSTTKHLRVGINAIEAFSGNYSNWNGSNSDYVISEPTSYSENGKAYLKIEATRPDKGYGAGVDHFIITLDDDSGDLLDIEYGFKTYYEDRLALDANDYNSISTYHVNNITYGGRVDFDGVLYSELDVDKNYGLTRQEKFDYSGFSDGVLSSSQSDRVVSNLKAFAKGTTRSVTEFDIPQFVDIHEGSYGVDSDGNYIVYGNLSGRAETIRYNNDFVETQGILNYADNGLLGHSAQNVEFTKQIQADDLGVTVVEYYDNLLESHTHKLSASEIEDVDRYLGVNPIYLDDAFLPMDIVSKCSINNSVSDDWNYYENNGEVVKNGSTLTGKFTYIYARNVWTPYRTFTVDFKIEDGFLSSYSFTCETYIDIETSQYTFDEVTYKFTNYREEMVDFTNTKINPDALPLSEVEETKESLYM